MLSEIQRKKINKSLPSGLFINRKYVLKFKFFHKRQRHEGTIGRVVVNGMYVPQVVNEGEIKLGKIKDELRLKRLGLEVPEEYMTMRQAVETYWALHASKKPGRYARGQKRMLHTIMNFFGPDTFIHSITTGDCRSFREHCAKRISTRTGRPITGSSVNKDHTTLIALFNGLERFQMEGEIKGNIKLPLRNPAKYVAKAEQTTNPTKPPTQEQYDALLINAADNGVRRIILGAAIMMRRKKELQGMSIDNVNMVAGTIRGRVSKGKTPDADRYYTVAITPVIRMLIETRPGNHLFNFSNWPKRWAITVARAGLKGKVEFRSLRKMGATQANLLGTDPRTIQDMLRHSSLDMTQIYLQSIPESMRTAAMKLDDKLRFRRQKVVTDSVTYTPRFKTPKYLKSLEKQPVSHETKIEGATPS